VCLAMANQDSLGIARIGVPRNTLRKFSAHLSHIANAGPEFSLKTQHGQFRPAQPVEIIRAPAYRFSSAILTSGTSVPGDRITIDCRSPRVVSVKLAVNPKLWATAWTWRPLLLERP
jgi:hypothetical protein